MAKGVFDAWDLADIKRILKDKERKRKEYEMDLADPDSRLLQEAAMMQPPSPEEIKKIKRLME
jgi:hypothetical protein